MLAKNFGYFAAEGLDVTINGYAGGSVGAQSVVAGQNDYGFTGSDQVVALSAAGQDVKILGVLSLVPGGQIVAQQGITSVKDLAGKTIGISRFGSGSDVISKIALHEAGVKTGKEVPVGAASSAVAAFAKHLIDAATVSEPTSGILRTQYHGATIVNLETLAGTEHFYGGVYPFNVLWSRSSYAQSHAAVTQKLLAALLKANEFLNTASVGQLKAKLPPATLASYQSIVLSALIKARGTWASSSQVSPAAMMRVINADAIVNPAVASGLEAKTLTPEKILAGNAIAPVKKKVVAAKRTGAKKKKKKTK